MTFLVTAAMVLTLGAVAVTTFAMVLTALDPRYVHPRLLRLQERMQRHMAPEWVRNRSENSEGQPLQEDGLAIFDELLVDAHEHEFSGGYAPAHAAAPTLTSDSKLPQAEVLLFLRAELAVQLGFNLDIRGTTVNVTRRQYARLMEYTAFAFNAIETPETYLGQYGITQIHMVRGGGKRLR